MVLAAPHGPDELSHVIGWLNAEFRDRISAETIERVLWEEVSLSPTKAVQALDRIEDLLRYAATKHLSVGVVTDGSGVVRLTYTTPTWDDLVELALDEIRALGAGQYQAVGRLGALFDALFADLPEHRRPALETRALCYRTRSSTRSARPSVSMRSSPIARASA